MENALLLSLSTTNVDALQLLYLARGVPPERPFIPAIRFKLDIQSDVNCKSDFRFDRATIYALTLHFALPEYVVTRNRDKVHCTEALCILLYRLSYPHRNLDLSSKFGRAEGPISRIFSHMIVYLYDRYSTLIYFHKSLCRRSIATYASAVEARSAPMPNVFGFIDGTKIAISRPSSRRGHRETLQKQVYSGHKRVHCLTYQSVVVPDGLAIYFWGPIEGKRHDVTLLHESKLIRSLGTVFTNAAVFLFCCLGKPQGPFSSDVVAVGNDAVVQKRSTDTPRR
ncbi:DDE superfamily endonuclease [Phytophthora infestans]|uniref:DDE superfamily endonuclease n=1 Tax=Phytophthora infestans TaxID=4787 RepID=A0A8S9TVC1_PHYIN|nr:DDE superfamily endonuclease [Phytophthora infestans]